MYKLIFSINNCEEVMVWPSVPVGFGPDIPQNNDTYEGLSCDFNIIGTMGLWSMPLSGTFPVGRRYPYMPADAETDGWKYVDFINRNRPRKMPFRVTLLDNQGVCRFNAACTIDNFHWEIKRNGDIAYSMDLRQYSFITASGVI